MHNISNHMPLQRKQLRHKLYIPLHTLAVRTIDMVIFPTRFMSARLYAGVFGVPRAAWIVQRVARHFTSHTNNLRLQIKTSNLHFLQVTFLHWLGIARIHLQCSGNSAAAPHLQLQKKLSYTQPALPQPNMQERSIHKHVYAFAVLELSVAMLACRCTDAAPNIAIRRQALRFRNSSQFLAQYKFSVF